MAGLHLTNYLSRAVRAQGGLSRATSPHWMTTHFQEVGCIRRLGRDSITRSLSTGGLNVSEIPLHLSHGLTIRRINERFAQIEDMGGSLPNGGTTGQVLTKQSDTDGDVAWESLVFSGGSA